MTAMVDHSFDESEDGAVIGSIHALAEEMIVRVARGTVSKHEIIDAFDTVWIGAAERPRRPTLQ